MSVFIPLRRRDNPHALFVGVIGVRLGDRVIQIGCAHGGRLAAVAGKVGLSGRMVVVTPDAPSAERARKGAASAGVLVEVEETPATRLQLEDASFDLAVIDDTRGLLSMARGSDQSGMLGEIFRVLRPGGRALVVAAGARRGLGAWLPGAQRSPWVDPTPWLLSDGFKAVRRLAEREGLVFIEGLKPKS